ncbi:hypothetical protein NDA01_16580 [Trichocoleus desertorum AS-A10]|uniref:hypothetical protein n=1 Tax=Trichocoleus desertorum TaxID=1481672 RepID=UPI0032973241
MSRWFQFWLSLSVLTITIAENLALPSYQAIAQLPPVAACNLASPQDNEVLTLLDQARIELDNRNTEAATRYLQAAFPNALQLSNAGKAELIQQWLLDPYEGHSVSRLQRLMQQAETQKSSASMRPLLDQLLQLTNRLTASHSFVKTRGLAAIAHHYVNLGQPQQAKLALSQAQQAARSIQGPIFTAQALTDVAAGYAALSSSSAASKNQAQTAQAVLAQVEQAIKQIPPNTSESLQAALWPRLAAIYAQIGDYAKANQTVARLPKNSESQSFAQRGVVEAYIAAQNLSTAEQLTQAIATPVQKGLALGKLAVGYSQAKQPQKATQLLRQAVQLAQSPTAGLDAITQDALLKAIVESYLQVGQRDEAFQLAKTALKGSQTEAIRAVAIAYAQAGQNNSVRQLLSERLRTIEAMPPSWDRQLVSPSLLQLVMDTQQFEWVRQEWPRLAALDYGLQDDRVVKMATAYAQSGQHHQALQWAKELPISDRPLLQVKLMTAIAREAHRQGETQWANELLQQTLQSLDPLLRAYDERIKREGGDLLERDRFKPQSLALVALVYAQSNQAEPTRRLLQQVSQLDVNMSDPAIAPPDPNPFALFMATEQYVGALQLAQATKNPEIRIARLQSSATALLKQNRFDLVLPVVDQITAADRKTQMLLAIAQRYGELQQVDKALPILAQAFRVAQSISGEESRVDRFGTDGATVMEASDDRGSLIEAIAVQYARFQQPTQALKVANTLQAKETREQALQAVKCAFSLKV